MKRNLIEDTLAALFYYKNNGDIERLQIVEDGLDYYIKKYLS